MKTLYKRDPITLTNITAIIVQAIILNNLFNNRAFFRLV